ncbi:hypothetical protein KQ304_05210 [Synechococcus sp. CS-1329]|jgi:hypothetical protein|uniref:hypothetical protein n=1 Tax=Synechococcus sp. CS-1329 TaxID=2847975 RepID=UPI00223BC571|nr:hypothetical protein [Synechococcus sp. CS-1329]MCT0218405.1 hypothetical protein [Synechococcus sp. CS-1329]
MAIPRLKGFLNGGLPLLLLLAAPLLAAPLRSLAQPLNQPQPLAVPPISDAPLQERPACPLLVPLQDAVLQPLQLRPAQVPRKNAGGCLSAADALYSADGCPRQLCPRQRDGLEL